MQNLIGWLRLELLWTLAMHTLGLALLAAAACTLAVATAYSTRMAGWRAFRFAVRPVVYLNSDVTVEQIQKTTGRTTPWSYDNSSPVAGSGYASNGEAGNHGN